MSENRSILITGAANGIGRAITQAMLQDGWTVLACDRDGEGLRALSREPAHPRSALHLFECDLADARATESLMANVRRVCPLDVLVNNAGIGIGNWKRPPKSWEISGADWDQFVRINATAPLLLLSCFAPEMMKRGWGRLISVTTSLSTMLRIPLYGPTKACSEAILSTFAYDLEDSGVTANVVVPGGMTNTGLVSDEVGVKRSDMLQPEVMIPPIQWLTSADSDGFSGNRIIAAHWSQKDSIDLNLARSASPLGWRSIAGSTVPPAGSFAKDR